MKKKSIVCLLLGLMLMIHLCQAADPTTLAIGSPAPDFNLKGIDGKMYRLADFSKSKLLVVVFTCNHCPTAQAYEDRLIQLTSDYASKQVAVVAINPNDPKSLRLDELDFSDLGDSYEEMKIRAAEKKFNFPYLYDGDDETASKAYGPIATPHAFVFDENRLLRYTGRVDDMESPFKTPRSTDTRNAIEALLNHQEVAVKTTKVFGCSVKWTEKRNLVQQFLDKWAKEPVDVQEISDPQIQALVANGSDKLRLLHLYSVADSACVREFPEFVSINRMYRDRDFEFLSVSVDAGQKEKVLGFLKNQQASNINYLLTTPGKSVLEQALKSDWKGRLPFTILIEPGGKIVYVREGPIDPARLKTTIVNNHLIGKYP